MQFRDRRLKWVGVGAAVLAALFILPAVPALYGDYLWFSSLGYSSVFLRVLAYSAALFLVASLLCFAALYVTILVTKRNLSAEGGFDVAGWPLAAAVVVSLVVGLLYAGSWETVLRYLNGVSFGRTDPVFGLDVSFYVYGLPFVNLVLGYLFLVTVLSFLLSTSIYVARFGLVEVQDFIGDGQQPNVEIDFMEVYRGVRNNAGGQMWFYLGAILVLVGLNFLVGRYELVYSGRGVVYGAGNTDLTVYLPLLTVLAVLSLAGAALVFGNVWLEDSRAVLVVGVLVAVYVLGVGVGAVYQGYVVEPDEFNKERPHIEDEIELTRTAFALDRIQERQFRVSDNLTRRGVEANPGTINNVRLWDYRPLLSTYNQQQNLRTYYLFNDVDIDRYWIDGNETQVMLSPREIDFTALSEQSQSWVNRHLVYTHGFGVTMSPVKEVSSEGLPEYYIKDVPPKSSVDVRIDQPRIYYGELTDYYTIVNTGTEELDYPSGERNVYNNYAGEGGVPLDSFWRELVYSVKFGSLEILFSDSVSRESRLQFNRDVMTRASTVAPFLEYDDDPYVVAADGGLYWIVDAYTTTDGYPYSRPIEFKDDRENYVRNSVKVVVNAYSGETTYYVADSSDPLIQTYDRIFPGLFRDFDEMPSGLRNHVRYPEDAFEAQSEVYLTYHMTDPQVFYSREDEWRIPRERARGEEQRMEAYYTIMKLPGEEEPEFVMIRPYIPRGKQNLIGWLAARSDRPNYGDLEAYLFSKQELVFGPAQVESRIDQDTEISQRITLWSQAGSNVWRGNLLAIPIEDSVLYVEPLFLESRGSGSLPELKRVIVSQGDDLTMQPSLEEALDVLFGGASDAEGGGLSAAEVERLRELYGEAENALRRGDFEAYGSRIDELGRRLGNASTNASASGAG